MELESLLQLIPSRKNIDQIIDIIRIDPIALQELWNIYLKNKGPESRRAAWALDLYNEEQLHLNLSQINEIVMRLPEFKHQGMRRHSLRIIAQYPIDESYLGQLADICFRWLESQDSEVAVKMYCIKILTDITEKVPEIARELIDIIQIQLNESSPGFKSIARKSLKILNKRIAV